MNEIAAPALHARFLRGLAASPGRAAIRVGAQTVSYEGAHRLALHWAGALLAGSPVRPHAVGVLAGKGIESYVGLLAALYTGATVVPLNPDFPAIRTRRMIELAGVSALVADARGLRTLAEISGPGADLPVLAPRAPGNGSAGRDGRCRMLPLRPTDALSAPMAVRASDTAYLLFTSGSTGRPKGVPITHGNAHHYFELIDRRYGFTAADVFSQTFDLNFDCAMFDLFAAWGAGATVQAVPAPAYRALPAFLAEHGITVWFSTPSSISLARRMGGLAVDAMPTLRWSLFAGEALQAADAADWQAAASRCTLENIYGPTELTVTVTGHRWSPRTSPELCVNGLAPIGTVHEGHDYLLLGTDGELCETEGELCITGPQLTAGYLDPDDDRGRFLDRAGRRWYRTGDRVRRLQNGELIYLGRLDSQVQVQGLRVELAEIEHALRGCAQVREAVAVARSAATGTELVVFYTGTPAPAADLARELRRILPAGMLPRQYRHLAELPLNSNRKVDRSRLAREAAAAAS
jgi:amino acid adenylation domain-containing protein